MGAVFHRERSIDPSSRNPKATRQGCKRTRALRPHATPSSHPSALVADCSQTTAFLRRGCRDDGQQTSRGKDERRNGVEGSVVLGRFENRRSRDGSTGAMPGMAAPRRDLGSPLRVVQSQHSRRPLQGSAAATASSDPAFVSGVRDWCLVSAASLHSPETPSLFLSPSTDGIYGLLCLPLRLRSLQRAKRGEEGATYIATCLAEQEDVIQRRSALGVCDPSGNGP